MTKEKGQTGPVGSTAVSDIVKEWADRHCLDGSPTDLSCAFDDAASSVEYKNLKAHVIVRRYRTALENIVLGEDGDKAHRAVAVARAALSGRE
jgi:hypothetical protein